jgi:hypothetical protein
MTSASFTKSLAVADYDDFLLLSAEALPPAAAAEPASLPVAVSSTGSR